MTPVSNFIPFHEINCIFHFSAIRHHDAHSRAETKCNAMDSRIKQDKVLSHSAGNCNSDMSILSL